ncbi:MAG TPA: DoxX family protein [Verrucomicrobiota bacterium]|nr:DoxX family protein [Verrucomicrobiota bacterium]
MKPARFPHRLAWTAQLVAAAILAQTLFFKFTAAPESVEIFTRLGAEPWGRVATGFLELVAVGLLLWPRAAPLGALLTLGLMSGAILAHLTRLGIAVQDDGGLLFALALVTWGCAAAVLWLRRVQLPRPAWRSRAGSL